MSAEAVLRRVHMSLARRFVDAITPFATARIVNGARNVFPKPVVEPLKRFIVFLLLLVALLVVIFTVAWIYHAMFGTLGGNA